MKKLAFFRFLYALRHSLPVIIVYLIGWYVLSILLTLLTSLNLFYEYVYTQNISFRDLADPKELRARMQDIMYSILADNSYVFICEAMFVLLLLIWLIARRLPLGLPRALYACPAGPREKLCFLRTYLTAKAAFLTLLLTVLWLFWFWTSLLPGPALAVQVSLTFFTVIAFSLNPDPGNRREALKECPDMVTEKSSKTVVNIYWSALLVLENTVFYSSLFALPSYSWPAAACWIPALLINIWIARKHITPLLRSMLDYEKLYYPLPEAEPAVQQ